MPVSPVSGDNLPAVAPANHGRTKAAWVANGGIIIGATLTAIGMSMPLDALTFSGVGVMVAALIAGGILKAAGHGQRFH